MSALDTQIGGGHYKGMKIQPMEYSMKNGLDACQHTAIKYISRFREKGGIQDLEKAKHCIDMLIEFEHQRLSEAERQDGMADPFPDTHLDIDEARIDVIGQNGNDGEHYTEVGGNSHGPQEDMTDPANWRAGDIVECVSPPDYNVSPIKLGRRYKLKRIGADSVYLVGDAPDAGWHHSRFRFHSRTSK